MSHPVRRRLAVVSALLLASLAGAGAVRAASVDAWVRVTGNVGEHVFAESLTFRLDADCDAPAEDVVLRYTVQGAAIINRRIPTFSPGARVSARHTEDLVRGQIAPASVVTWWWTLTDADGRTFETPRESLRYLDERFDWRSLASRGVRVWWYDRDRPYAEGIAEDAGSALERVARLVGTPRETRVEVVAYQSQDDLRPALVARGSTYESRLATLGARVAPDILVLDAGTRPQDLAEVIAHELSHLVLHQRFGHEYLDAAMWLDEGLAMYAEGPLSRDEQRLFDGAVRDDALISVRSLTTFPGDAELVPLAYAESRELVAFLIGLQGEAAFMRLIDVIASGDATTDHALQQVYGLDQLALYQAFRAHLGLAPATTPAPGTATPRRRDPVDRTPVGPCAAAALLLPVAATVTARSRHRA